MQMLLLLFIIMMSITAFLTMARDKKAAIARKHRVPERTLWKLAFLGGGIGAYLGMITYRHKTKHLSFRIGFTLLAIAQVSLIVWAGSFFN